MIRDLSTRSKLALGASALVVLLGAGMVGVAASNAKGHIQSLQAADRDFAKELVHDDAVLQLEVARLETRILALESYVATVTEVGDATVLVEDNDMRAQTRARAKTYLGYSDADYSQLADSFTVLRGPLSPARRAEWKRDVSDTFQDQLATAPTLDTVFYDRATRSELPTDTAFAPPRLTLTNADSQHPRFTVSEVPKGAQIYLEIDSRADFTGRNLARFPSLAPLFVQSDNAHRNSQTLQLFQARAEGWPTAGTPFRLPFRASSFALDPDGVPGFSDFAHYAQLLTHGLDTDDAIAETVEVVNRRIDHGGASGPRSPLETYIAGVDECGHVNEFLGSILEMDGIRYRGVSGFHPWVQPVMPGAGHSAIEVEGPDGAWEYADAFVPFHTPDTSAAELAETPGRGPALFKTPSQAMSRMGLDEDVNISDLFRFRRYFDKSRRQRTASALELLEGEADYGRDFALRPLQARDQLDPVLHLPAERTVYVRARYVVSDLCKIGLRVGCSDLNAVASPWTVESFTIDPRALLDTSDRP